MGNHHYDDVQNTRITGHHLDEGDQYKYDGAKRLISVLRGVATANITNSFASNLSGASYREFGEFLYDQTGNRLTRRLAGSNDQTFQHDKANQISTEGGSAVSHDKNGNYTASSNAHRYTWNNQWGVYIKAGSPAVTHTWHYDAIGRKIEWNDGTREHHFYYDGQQIVELAEIISGSEVSRKLQVWGERVDDLVAYEYQVPDPDRALLVHSDHLGSVAILVEPDGDIAEGYRYGEWGQTTIVDSTFAKLTTTEGDLKNNVRYTGRDQYTAIGDPADSWYNNRARALRTKWGRFVQPTEERSNDPYAQNGGPTGPASAACGCKASIDFQKLNDPDHTTGTGSACNVGIKNTSGSFADGDCCAGVDCDFDIMVEVHIFTVTCPDFVPGKFSITPAGSAPGIPADPDVDCPDCGGHGKPIPYGHDWYSGAPGTGLYNPPIGPPFTPADAAVSMHFMFDIACNYKYQYIFGWVSMTGDLLGGVLTLKCDNCAKSQAGEPGKTDPKGD